MRGRRIFNRGLILFLVVLAVLTTYLIGQSVVRASQEQEIQRVCMDFTNCYGQCLVIPEELYPLSDTYSEEAFSQYKAACYEQLSAFCCETNTVKSMLSYVLDSLAGSGGCITKFGNASIRNISITFHGDTVSVWMDTNVNYKTVYPGGYPQESGTQTAYPAFTFELKKEGGQWKLLSFGPDLYAYMDGYGEGYYDYDMGGFD